MSDRMQSLLSRAVEDQLSEQRQLAAAVTDVRANLLRMTTQLEAMQRAGSPDQRAVEEVAGELRQAVRVLGERIDVVSRLVQQRGADLSELKAAVGDVKASVDQQAAALDGLTGGLSALPSFGGRIDALHAGVAALQDRLSGPEELAGALAGLDQRATAVESALRDLRQEVTALGGRMGQLADRASVDAVMARVSGNVGSATSRLVRIETTLPSLLERLDGIEASIGRQRAAYESLVERLDATIGDTARDEAAALAAGLADVRAQLDELAGRVAAGAEVEVVAARLDEVFDALFGDGGIQAQLGDLLEEGRGRDDVADVVGRAVALSEGRLVRHIDDAVLALADALLRRKSRPDRAPIWPPVAEPMGAAVAASMTRMTAPAAGPTEPEDADELEEQEAEFDDDEDLEDDEELEGQEDELDEAEDEEELEGQEDELEGEDLEEEEPDEDADDYDETAEADEPELPWQTPPATVAADDDEARGRRRPWWRPSD